MSAELKASRRDATLILTLSNPGMGNALHSDMSAAAIETMSTAERDHSIRAVIVTGANGAFSNGVDPGQLLDSRAPDKPGHTDALDNLQGWIDAIRDCPKPVIAAVERTASGAGFSLALACDLIVSGASARFAMSQVSAGLPPDGGASWFLARALPRQLAAEILIDGLPVTAQRLHAAGVINRVVPDGCALDAALAWAEDIAKLPANAAERIKSLLRDAHTCSLTEQFASEKRHLLDRLGESDGAATIRSFLRTRQAEG